MYNVHCTASCPELEYCLARIAIEETFCTYNPFAFFKVRLTDLSLSYKHYRNTLDILDMISFQLLVLESGRMRLSVQGELVDLGVLELSRRDLVLEQSVDLAERSVFGLWKSEPAP